jgi:hypothetical protein
LKLHVKFAARHVALTLLAPWAQSVAQAPHEDALDLDDSQPGRLALQSRKDAVPGRRRFKCFSAKKTVLRKIV